MTLNFKFKFLSCKFLLRSLVRENKQLLSNFKENVIFANHFVHENNYDKSLLASSYEFVRLTWPLFRSEMLKFSLNIKISYNTINIDLLNGVEIKEV